MAECKACGEWFGSSKDELLCPACERAVKRLGRYVKPVVRGKWVKPVPGDGGVKCSVCGTAAPSSGGLFPYPVRSDFCLGCGADMREA